MRFLIIAACMAFTTAGDMTAFAQDAAPGAAGDGGSIAHAIRIQAQNEPEGVDAEYRWIADRYPGYKRDKQALVHQGGRYYDVLDITTANGEQKTFYFDITGFFGKL